MIKFFWEQSYSMVQWKLAVDQYSFFLFSSDHWAGHFLSPGHHPVCSILVSVGSMCQQPPLGHCCRYCSRPCQPLTTGYENIEGIILTRVDNNAKLMLMVNTRFLLMSLQAAWLIN